MAAVVVNLVERRVHRSGTYSRRGEAGRGRLYLNATLSPPK